MRVIRIAVVPAYQQVSPASNKVALIKALAAQPAVTTLAVAASGPAPLAVSGLSGRVVGGLLVVRLLGRAVRGLLWLGRAVWCVGLAGQ